MRIKGAIVESRVINYPFEKDLGFLYVIIFTGETASAIQYGSYRAVIPTITGSASTCGLNTLLIDSHDPLKHGFILR